MFEIGLGGAILFAITLACAVSGIIYDDYKYELEEDKKTYKFDPDTGVIYEL